MNGEMGAWGWAALDNRLGSESEMSDNKYQNPTLFELLCWITVIELKM